MGTLLAFTISAISVLILRYIPPNDQVQFPPSLHEPIDSAAMQYGWDHLETNEKEIKANVSTYGNQTPLLVKEDVSIDYPLIAKYLTISNCE